MQGTYETFAACAKKHFNADLKGKFVLTCGLGGMGGAQTLAATLNGAAILGIDVDVTRIQKRIDTGYCDVLAKDLGRGDETCDGCEGKRYGTFSRACW